MAITKIHPITTTLTKALNYIQNPKKTDGTLLVDGYGCVPETAYQQFMRTKEKVDKKDGYLAFHLIQSFSPGEVDYETAHKIGIELADKVFKGRFQYVIATHIDRGNGTGIDECSILRSVKLRFQICNLIPEFRTEEKNLEKGLDIFLGLCFWTFRKIFQKRLDI